MYVEFRTSASQSEMYWDTLTQKSISRLWANHEYYQLILRWQAYMVEIDKCRISLKLVYKQAYERFEMWVILSRYNFVSNIYLTQNTSTRVVLITTPRIVSTYRSEHLHQMSISHQRQLLQSAACCTNGDCCHNLKQSYDHNNLVSST